MPRRPDLLVSADRLRWRCDPDVFGAESSADLDPERRVIGQERALRALKLGSEMRSPGYNVFVSGLSGTGRTSAVRHLLVGLADRCIEVPDKLYVHNFDDRLRPSLLQFPRGQGRAFGQRLHDFSRHVHKHLPARFEDLDYVGQRRKLEEASQQSHAERLAEFSEECRLAGLALIQTKTAEGVRPGLGLAVEEEVFPIESLRGLVKTGKLEEARADLLAKNAARLHDKLDAEVLASRKEMRQLESDLEEFDRRQAREVFTAELTEIREEFPHDGVDAWLTALEEDLVEHLELFQHDASDPDVLDSYLVRLEVNVLLDHAEAENAPLHVESNPTYTNLFGTVERVVHANGQVSTDHTRIRAGSLAQADGGFLILTAEDLLSDATVWNTLKRTLRTGELEIQPKETAYGMAPILFKPHPLPLQLKVILIGDVHLYSQLQTYDPDFRKTFKVRADFDSIMERTPENIRRYGTFLARLAQDESLLPYDKTAMARLVEEAARLCETGDKLSTHFGLVADLAREANYHASGDGAKHVTAAHVDRARSGAIEREDLYDQRLQERIQDGSILVDTTGEAVGQVNALTVFGSGRFSFGKPARITATVAAGDAGLLNIEREVQLSGEIHDKGVLILSSYFRERWGQEHPLAFSASLCFEQNYAGVDGDSASSTELYLLVSALSDVPLSQQVAVTGSVDQKGVIQPIGGVNEKIEGFFEICESRGLTGEQGAILPHQNVDELMLSPAVIAAVEAGKFHLWAIKHVDEGLEILTGVPAGTADDERDGGDEPETLHGRVAKRLRHLAELSRDFKGSHHEEEGGDEHGESGSGETTEDNPETPVDPPPIKT